MTFHLVDPRDGSGGSLSDAEARELVSLPFHHPSRHESAASIVRSPAISPDSIRGIAVEHIEHLCGPEDAAEESRSGMSCHDYRGTIIRLTLNSEGSQQLTRLTREHLRWRLALVRKDQILAAPVIRDTIANGTAVIEISLDEAEEKEWQALASTCRGGP